MENNLQEVINNETVEQVCEGATKSNGGLGKMLLGGAIGFVSAIAVPKIVRAMKNRRKKGADEVETEEIIDNEQSEE